MFLIILLPGFILNCLETTCVFWLVARLAFCRSRDASPAPSISYVNRNMNTNLLTKFDAMSSTHPRRRCHPTQFCSISQLRLPELVPKSLQQLHREASMSEVGSKCYTYPLTDFQIRMYTPCSCLFRVSAGSRTEPAQTIINKQSKQSPNPIATG